MARVKRRKRKAKLDPRVRAALQHLFHTYDSEAAIPPAYCPPPLE